MSSRLQTAIVAVLCPERLSASNRLVRIFASLSNLGNVVEAACSARATACKDVAVGRDHLYKAVATGPHSGQNQAVS